MDNHIHLLLRSGTFAIATVTRRFLTGYAWQFDRKHKCYGKLFQNRCKSILCEEVPYLLKLSCVDVPRALGLSRSTVSKAVARGENITRLKMLLEP